MWQQINDKQHWNMLAASVPHAQFLQSWQWGEFQRAYGRRVLRISWKDQVLLQCIGMPLKLRKFYWYIPRGPIEIDPSEKRAAFSELKEALNARGGIFARIDPFKNDFWNASLKKRANISSIQPQCTRILDIASTKEEYFEKGLHQKTRYNICLAERKGVEICHGEINNFLNLNAQTSARNKFISHPNSYYIIMAKTLSENRAQWHDCSIKIWEAKYKNTAVASNIIIYFGDTIYYAHGASGSKHRNSMAPYLLRWKIIEDGIKHGYKYHDLGGVNPLSESSGSEDRNHPGYKPSWEGISQFKKGFGGNVHCYPESFDLIFNPLWYKVYELSRYVRRVLRV